MGCDQSNVVDDVLSWTDTASTAAGKVQPTASSHSPTLVPDSLFSLFVSLVSHSLLTPFSQGADNLSPEDITFTVAGEVQPTAQQLQDLKFAWRCVKHVKSNAITVAKDGKLLGMGSGQPNR